MAVSTLREPASPPSLDDPQAGVIDHARRRQRRRRRTIVSLSLLVVSAGLAAYALSDNEPVHRQPSPRPPTAIAAGAVLAATPHMGVACTDPNTIACDRVGLSLILRHPALAVQATVAGRTFSLDPDVPHHFHRIDTPNPDARAPAIAFAGYLRPAGLRDRLHVTPDVDPTHWIGRNAPAPVVRLRITQPDGSTLSTRVRTRLSAGWG
jgi:hypothetical protein